MIINNVTNRSYYKDLQQSAAMSNNNTLRLHVNNYVSMSWASLIPSPRLFVGSLTDDLMPGSSILFALNSAVSESRLNSNYKT